MEIRNCDSDGIVYASGGRDAGSIPSYFIFSPFCPLLWDGGVGFFCVRGRRKVDLSVKKWCTPDLESKKW